MREIKFRAFLKEAKAIKPVNDLTFNSLEEYLVGVNDCGNEDCSTCVDWYKLEDVILMQCTGLKDANGVEIYEGDVVDVSFSNQVGEMDWMKLVMKNPFDYDLNEANLLNFADQLKVIGNIYENPELLGA